MQADETVGLNWQLMQLAGCFSWHSVNYIYHLKTASTTPNSVVHPRHNVAVNVSSVVFFYNGKYFINLIA